MATVSITEDVESYLASLRSYLDTDSGSRKGQNAAGSESKAGLQRSGSQKPVSVLTEEMKRLNRGNCFSDSGSRG